MVVLVDKGQAVRDLNVANLKDVLNSNFFGDLHGWRRKLSA
jgi:hypothetical protein